MEPTAFIAIFAQLAAILRGDVQHANDILAQRKRLASELRGNCEQWSRELLSTFNSALERWKVEGREAAVREIVELQRDFMKLDYSSLKSSSPTLDFLRKDKRFGPFVDSCLAFYDSALDLKRLVYGSFEKQPGNFVLANQEEVSAIVELWHEEVERMLEKVRFEHMTVQVLMPG